MFPEFYGQHLQTESDRGEGLVDAVVEFPRDPAPLEILSFQGGLRQAKRPFRASLLDRQSEFGRNRADQFHKSVVLIPRLEDEESKNRDHLLSSQDRNGERTLEAGLGRQARSGKLRVDADVADPEGGLRSPNATWQAFAGAEREVATLRAEEGQSPKRPGPDWAANKSQPFGVRDPGFTEGPSRGFAEYPKGGGLFAAQSGPGRFGD